MRRAVNGTISHSPLVVSLYWRKRIQNGLMGAIPWGFSYAQKGVLCMGYRKVGYLEQVWYILKYKLGNRKRRR